MHKNHITNTQIKGTRNGKMKEIKFTGESIKDSEGVIAPKTLCLSKKSIYFKA